jgi:hypothetical protein
MADALDLKFNSINRVGVQVPQWAFIKIIKKCLCRDSSVVERCAENAKVKGSILFLDMTLKFNPKRSVKKKFAGAFFILDSN